MTNDNITPETDSARALIGLALCEASGKLHLLSLLFIPIALLGGLLFGMDHNGNFALLYGVVVLIGFPETFLAWRLAFDRPIFAAWARLKGEALLKAQQEFDDACATFSEHSSSIPTRSMQDRLNGVKYLSLFQVVAVIAQVGILLVPIVLYFVGKLFE